MIWPTGNDRAGGFTCEGVNGRRFWAGVTIG